MQKSPAPAEAMHCANSGDIYSIQWAFSPEAVNKCLVSLCENTEESSSQNKALIYVMRLPHLKFTFGQRCPVTKSLFSYNDGCELKM